MSSEVAREARRLYEAGVPVREIMRRLGIRSCASLYKLLGEARRKIKRGAKKLTNEELSKICEELMSESVYAVARRWGLSTSRVHSIKKRHCASSASRADLGRTEEPIS
ncbi:MAG: hypothetical protein QXU97_03860 [Fervidicoccaceae archaeon]